MTDLLHTPISPTEYKECAFKLYTYAIDNSRETTLGLVKETKFQTNTRMILLQNLSWNNSSINYASLHRVPFHYYVRKSISLGRTIVGRVRRIQSIPIQFCCKTCYYFPIYLPLAFH